MTKILLGTLTKVPLGVFLRNPIKLSNRFLIKNSWIFPKILNFWAKFLNILK
jgi:hypothetical protein